jgi:predicted small lipoprotein YifL
MMLMQISPRAISLRVLAFTLAAALGITGCGIKGPLQPAPKSPPAAAAPSTPTDQEATPRERKQ